MDKLMKNIMKAGWGKYRLIKVHSIKTTYALYDVFLVFKDRIGNTYYMVHCEMSRDSCEHSDSGIIFTGTLKDFVEKGYIDKFRAEELEARYAY